MFTGTNILLIYQLLALGSLLYPLHLQFGYLNQALLSYTIVATVFCRICRIGKVFGCGGGTRTPNLISGLWARHATNYTTPLCQDAKMPFAFFLARSLMLTADGSTGSRFSSPVISAKITRYLVAKEGFEPSPHTLMRVCVLPVDSTATVHTPLGYIIL